MTDCSCDELCRGLFAECGPFEAYLAQLQASVERLIDELPEDQLLARTAEEHARAIESQLFPRIPELLLDRVKLRRETISGGSIIVFAIPFSGTSALFRYTPNKTAEILPRGAVSEVLNVAVAMKNQTADDIEAAYWKTIELVNRSLAALGEQLGAFQQDMRARLSGAIIARQSEVSRERGVAKDLVRRFNVGEASPVADRGDGCVPERPIRGSEWLATERLVLTDYASCADASGEMGHSKAGDI